MSDKSSEDGKGCAGGAPNETVMAESKAADPVINEEDEYSDVIDEPPARKRRKTTKKEPGEKAPKAPKASKASKPSKSAAEASDPLEAEVKKLQGQLKKCGVRKLWHHELKGCDDARDKIRHLKKMLTDIGMEGRFSEAKAREIKETRELLADAEAAQEMNRLWGSDKGGRASRNKSRGVKMVESDGSDGKAGNSRDNSDEDDDDGQEETHKGATGEGDEDEDVSFAARRRRAHADLAFLGDDSDSDSG